MPLFDGGIGVSDWATTITKATYEAGTGIEEVKELQKNNAILSYAMLLTLIEGGSNFDKLEMIKNLEKCKSEFKDLDFGQFNKIFNIGEVMSEVINSLSDTENILYKLDNEDLKR
jgi:hypothetical protein